MACDIDGPSVRRVDGAIAYGQSRFFVEARCAMLVAKILSGTRPG
jgi:hypothetical protein